MMTKMFKFFLICAILLSCNSAMRGQGMSRNEILKNSGELLGKGLTELRELLTIPNNGRIESHVRANIEWSNAKLKQLGFQSQELAIGGYPVVFGERVFDINKESILFYIQMDGQPVDTASWDQANPYEPTLKRPSGEGWETIPWVSDESGYDLNWRLFARSAADSKGPAIAFFTALEYMISQKAFPDFNIKVVMDFQEELGSADLPGIVQKYKGLFEAKMMLVMDGTRFLNNQPTLTFGARGIARATIKVFGAKNNLHSGHYGNFAPNPVFALSRLLAGMKDEQGKVLIPGYYDGIEISKEERELMDQTQEDVGAMKKKIGVAEVDQVGETYQESLAYPSLNVRGLKAAWVGAQVRTTIPNEAIAEIDIRLVPETDGQRQIDLIKAYIKNAGYHFVEGEPTDEEREKYAKLVSFSYNLGSNPFRTNLNSDIGRWLDQAMTRAFGKGNYTKLRTTGGSQPIAPFINTLDIPAVSIRIPDPASNIHAPNENIRIGNFLEGIQMCLAILSQKL